MSLWADLRFSLEGRCPVCREGKLFKKHLNIVDACAHCGVRLGDHDIGDGAAVFLIFLLGFSVVPLVWVLDHFLTLPLFLSLGVAAAVMFGMIFALLPGLKSYIMFLQYRHRPGDWKK